LYSCLVRPVSSRLTRLLRFWHRVGFGACCVPTRWPTCVCRPLGLQLGSLRGLVNLSQLSVEDNLITSFDGLQALRSLMELYIGNNNIPSLKVGRIHACICACCIFPYPPCLPPYLRVFAHLHCLALPQDVRDLKDLPKLIIVDMTGNPLVSADDYRLYTVYFLRKLKVHRPEPRTACTLFAR
jgi:Leucine-rich repeat (LRR) protein